MDPGLRRGDEIVERWDRVREMRALVSANIEPMRREKQLGSSLEAAVSVRAEDAETIAILESIDFAEVCIVSEMMVERQPQANDSVTIRSTAHHKCGRCWRHLPEVTEDGDLCSRCEQVVSAMDVPQ